MSDYELETAQRETARNAAEDEYFKARPQIDNHDRRKVFQAGFDRAYESLRQQLADTQRKLEAAEKAVCAWTEVAKVAREYIKKELSQTSRSMDKVIGNEKLYLPLRERFNNLIGHLNTVDRAIEQSKGGDDGN